MIDGMVCSWFAVAAIHWRSLSLLFARVTNIHSSSANAAEDKTGTQQPYLLWMAVVSKSILSIDGKLFLHRIPRLPIHHCRAGANIFPMLRGHTGKFFINPFIPVAPYFANIDGV